MLEYKTLEECVASGDHLQDCDDVLSFEKISGIFRINLVGGFTDIKPTKDLK